VIRRLFWLTLGAVAGVTGYRRLSRLMRAIQPVPGRGGRRGWPGRPGWAGRPGSASGLTAFLRDVRDGMAQYADQRASAAGPIPDRQQVHTERSSPAATRSYPGTHYAKDGR
jgi:hypothetical protein